LNHTTVAVGTAMPSPTAHGYFLNQGALSDVTNLSPSLAWGQGTVISTVDDLREFFDALFAGKVVPKALLSEMMTTRKGSGGETLGLGLQQVELPCGTVVGHSGDIPGYHASSFNDLSRDRQVTVFANVLTLDDQVGTPESYALHDQLIFDAFCGASS